MGVDLDQELRVLFDDDGFVAASISIARKVREDLTIGEIPRSRIEAQFDAIARAIKKLSPPAEEVLSINLTKVCGNVEAGRATYHNFLSALYQDTRDLGRRTRPYLVGAVFQVFRQHSLPIDRTPGGLLAAYFGLIVEASGAPWPVEQLVSETYEKHEGGWYPRQT